MKASEIKNMSIDEIKAREADLSKELFNLRMRHVTSQLENPMKIRMVRKDIARIRTIIAEKERGA